MEVTRYVHVDLNEEADGHVVGHAARLDHLRDEHGIVRTGALLTMLDYAGGLCGGLAALPDGWVVSTNMAARCVAPAREGPLRADARVLRVGRNNVVTGIEIRANGVLVVDGVLTSAILIPENGPPQWSRPLVIAQQPLERVLEPMDEWLQLRVLDDGVEIDIEDRLRNPWGIMHGGVVAMLADLAAVRTQRSHGRRSEGAIDTGTRTTDMTLQYLAPNRTGPVRATTTTLGRRSDGQLKRIEVRDVGADRVTAVAIATATA